MKKLVSALFCIPVIFAASCSKEQSFNDNTEELVPISFESSVVDTKAVLNSDRSVSWEANDKIFIFAKGNAGQVFTSTSAGTSTSFTGEAVAADTYYALYPNRSGSTCTDAGIISSSIPQFQNPVSGSFFRAGALMAGVSSGNSIEFKHAGAYLKLTIPSTEGTIKRMDIYATNGESLSGNVTIDATASPIVVSSTSTGGCVSIFMTDNTKPIPAGTYYFPVVPGTKADGMYIKLTDTSGEEYIAFNANSLTLTSGKVCNIGTLKSSKSFVFESFESNVRPTHIYNTSNYTLLEDTDGNGRKTSTNPSRYSAKVIGQINIRWDKESYPTGYRMFPFKKIGPYYTKFSMLVWIGANPYCPTITFTNTASQNASNVQPTRINGVTLTSEAVWNANVKADDWNLLEWDAASLTFGGSAASNFSTIRSAQFNPLRTYSTPSSNSSTGDKFVFIDEISFAQ